MFGMNDPWKKSFQLSPCRDLCFDLDLLQGQFILPAGQQLSGFACKVYIYTVFRHDDIIQGEITCHIRQNGCFL